MSLSLLRACNHRGILCKYFFPYRVADRACLCSHSLVCADPDIRGPPRPYKALRRKGPVDTLHEVVLLAAAAQMGRDAKARRADLVE
jgi:hypothetical protein